MGRPSVREEIVQAALVEFHRRGFNACSVEDITTAAGVPKGSFYNHFKGKEELAIEVLGRFADATPHELLQQREVPPLKRLKKYFTTLGEGFLACDCHQGCMLGNFAAEMEIGRASCRERV